MHELARYFTDQRNYPCTVRN